MVESWLLSIGVLAAVVVGIVLGFDMNYQTELATTKDKLATLMRSIRIGEDRAVFEQQLGQEIPQVDTRDEWGAPRVLGWISNRQSPPHDVRYGYAIPNACGFNYRGVIVHYDARDRVQAWQWDQFRELSCP